MPENLTIWKKKDLIRDEIDIIDLNEKEFYFYKDNIYFGFRNNNTYDGTLHYFTFCSKAEIRHLHVYQKIRTGDSRLKQFDFTRLYKNSDLSIEEFSQFLCFIRFYLKLARPFSLIKFCKEFSKLHKESRNINNEILSKIQLKAENKKLLFILSSHKNLFKLWYYSNKLYKNIIKDKNIDFVYQSCSLEFTKKIVYQLRNKLLKSNRTPLFKSRIISVCGPDGSGKSTISFFLYKFFKSQSGCFYFHYGLPNITIFDQFKNKILNIKSRSKSKNSIKNISFIKRLYYLDLAYRRLRTCLISLWLSKIGYIIIFDRYYNASPNGTIDCPNITTGLFSKFERILYELTPKIDISIYLKTEIDNVVRQNNQRHKIGKESSEEIKHRYNLFEDYDSYAKEKKLLYNNNISLNDLKKLVLTSIYDN